MKVLLVVGVIAMHTAITYGLDGSWYLESYDEMAGGVVAAVTAVLGVGWLFGLGLFFLIAGRLSSPSLERKGPRRFAKDRLIRLGIPLAAYTLLVSPGLEYVDYRENQHGTEAFWPFVREQVWHFAPGPTWFLEALLAFSLAYTLWRALRVGARPPVWRRLRGAEVAGVALAIGVSAFAVHLVFPAVLLAGGFFDGGAAEDRFAGGWHWQAAAGTLMDGLLATCVSLWAVAHFRTHEERYFRPLIRRMAPPAYGAFIIHPPVLVGPAFAVQPLPVPAELKFVAVLLAGVAGSFGLTELARRRVLDHRGHAHPDADAHRRESVTRAAAA